MQLKSLPKKRNNNTIAYWELTGMLVGLKEKDKKEIIKLLNIADDIIEENEECHAKTYGRSGANIYIKPVIRRIYNLLFTSQDDNTKMYLTILENPKLRSAIFKQLTSELKKLAEILNDYSNYVILGEKYFTQLDWEAEACALFSNNHAYRIYEESKAKIGKSNIKSSQNKKKSYRIN